MKNLLPASGYLFVGQNDRPQPLVLLSACLAGDRVRYDGRHKRHVQLIASLQGKAGFTTICPEVSANLGIPRPPVQLRESEPQPAQESEQHFRVLGRDEPIDVTELLQQTSQSLSENFAQQALCAAVLQSRSPSCGIASTPVFNNSGEITRISDGLFAAALHRKCPYLPMWPDHELSADYTCRSLLSQALMIQELMYLIRDDALPQWLSFYEPLFGAWLGNEITAMLPEKNQQRGELAILLNTLFSQYRMQWTTLHTPGD